MSFTPSGTRLLVKVDEPRIQTPGGLTIPESAQEPQLTGTVKASNNDFNYSVGTRVCFGRYDGTELKLDGTKYLLIDEKDVFGVLSD